MVFFFSPFNLVKSVGSLGFNGANNTVEHVYVSDVVFRGTSNGARIKTWQVIIIQMYRPTYSHFD